MFLTSGPGPEGHWSTEQHQDLQVSCFSSTLTDLHLLVSVLRGVLAALALPAQLLQLGLALLQTLPFALVLRLVLLQRRLRGAAHGKQGARPHWICYTDSSQPDKWCVSDSLPDDWDPVGGRSCSF